jgi:uncharacterized protein YbjQ (UPF0145 family)
MADRNGIICKPGREEIMRTIGPCPVTGGNPTKMRTCDNFWRQCASRENDEYAKCQQCETLPAEVIITYNLRGETMAESRDRVPGKCEICGEEKNVKTVWNKKTCSNCEFVWRAANNYPARVIACLEMAGKTLGKYEEATHLESDRKAIDRLTNDNEILKADLTRIKAEFEKTQEDLISETIDKEKLIMEIQEINESKWEVINENAVFKEKLVEVITERDSLRDQLENMASQVQTTGKSKDGLLLDLTCSIVLNERIDVDVIKHLRN